MDIFLWGHLEEHVCAVPPGIIGDLVARLQAAVTTVDANMLKRKCRAEAASNICCNYEAPMA
jgi:hypothetical protein